MEAKLSVSCFRASCAARLITEEDWGQQQSMGAASRAQIGYSFGQAVALQNRRDLETISWHNKALPKQKAPILVTGNKRTAIDNAIHSRTDLGSVP